MRAKKLRIEIQTDDEWFEDVARTVEAIQRRERVSKTETLSFPSLEALRACLTPQRIALVRLIRRHKPQSVYELAAVAHRDRKSVTQDLEYLVGLGLVELSSVRGSGRARSVPTVPFSRIEIGVEV